MQKGLKLSLHLIVTDFFTVFPPQFNITILIEAISVIPNYFLQHQKHGKPHLNSIIFCVCIIIRIKPSLYCHTLVYNFNLKRHFSFYCSQCVFYMGVSLYSPAGVEVVKLVARDNVKLEFVSPSAE